mmetsp:Transcript_20817/g.45123  ORF Transcript_20817/g.45123 Transcript_20817/m.45123 type:complete len:234 (+) Transcript_20817:1061-1762(+)
MHQGRDTQAGLTGRNQDDARPEGPGPDQGQDQSQDQDPGAALEGIGEERGEADQGLLLPVRPGHGRSRGGRDRNPDHRIRGGRLPRLQPKQPCVNWHLLRKQCKLQWKRQSRNPHQRQQHQHQQPPLLQLLRARAQAQVQMPLQKTHQPWQQSHRPQPPQRHKKHPQQTLQQCRWLRNRLIQLPLRSRREYEWSASTCPQWRTNSHPASSHHGAQFRIQRISSCLWSCTASPP